MKTFPILYKRSSKGAPQQWQIFAEGNSYRTEAGQVGGVITHSSPTICDGKNLGKKNETSPEEQAILEAASKHQKKLDSGYFESIEEIDDAPKFFAPMLAHKYKDYKDKISWPRFASRKIDGERFIILKNGIFSRKGKEIFSCPHISNALTKFFNNFPNAVVDGEGYAHGEDFEEVMSILNTKKPSIEDLSTSEKKAQLWIFDGYLSDPSEGISKRLSTLKTEILASVEEKYLKYFVFVENSLVQNHDEFIALHDKFVEEGFEGAMLRSISAPYVNKRTKDLLKEKNFVDDEYIIVDILDGRGGKTGIASKIIVDLGNGKTSEAGVKGSEKYAAIIFKNRKKYIGKKCTVRYQNFTKEGKLRFGKVLPFQIDPIDK